VEAEWWRSEYVDYIVPHGRLTDELKRIEKEAVVA
jgi:hypothetical protein